MLRAVLPHTARQFRRAIVMPNLKPPVVTTELARCYRERILSALPKGSDFEPLMTLYLTDNTSPEEIRRAKKSGWLHAAKLYPAGATTNSAAGVTDLRKIYPVFAVMQEVGLTLSLHGEVVDHSVDVFDREREFIDKKLVMLRRDFPELKIVLEHITTQDAVDYVRQSHGNTAATITAHHLLYNRNSMFYGGIRPHYYCLPVLKREKHRQALVRAATSGDPAFFLGTDSAPHASSMKESACGCAGCYTALHAMELYATAFEAAGALEKLEGFASFYGPDFYGLPRNSGVVTLVKTEYVLPERLLLGAAGAIIPLAAGETLHWKLISKLEESPIL